MARNLKYQFLNAINKSFSSGSDKHSNKKNGGLDATKIYSYADRKNLIEMSSQFSDFMNVNYKSIRMIKEITSDHAQEFLNYKSKTCNENTLNQYSSRISKLNNITGSIYNISNSYDDIVAPSGINNTKIRNISMCESDLEKLKSTYSDDFSTGLLAINLSSRLGLRVEECSKLKTTDIDLNSNLVRVIDSKGKRSRYVPIKEKDLDYFNNLKYNCPRLRICDANKESINRNIRRHLKQCDLDDKYNKTTIHSIRKHYAQESFNEKREEGLSIKEAMGQVSELLGHSANRIELMKEYILDIN